MTFNKAKSMRAAEKHLTNGRIDAAIAEYRQIVDHDPKDITTQNMLGDLYVKAARVDRAVDCYRRVADFYNKQGFAKKAIAVYNKIHKIKPSLTDVVGKLAALYHVRGSIAEARNHYKMFAERLEREGKNIEVLEVWQKIAELDTSDHEICLKIAAAQRKRNQKDEACKAFYEAAVRLDATGDHEGAGRAYSSALEINERFTKAVRGLVASMIKSGSAAKAADLLEEKLAEDPYNREYTFLLIDCHFELGDAEKAEKVITKLVEREPANYPKLLDLVKVYLDKGDAGSAVRVLSMLSEHLLAGGDAETLESHLAKVLAADAENLEALRLLARCYGWQRKQAHLKEALEKMADAAGVAGSRIDERWALSQYLVLVPHDSARQARFEELVEEIGAGADEEEELLGENAEGASSPSSGFGLESEAEFASVNDSGSGLITHPFGEENGHAEVPVTVLETESVYEVADTHVTVVSGPKQAAADQDRGERKVVTTPLSPAEEVRLDEELVSIRFYIEQGYDGLADKSLCALEVEFGNRPEIVELRDGLSDNTASANDLSSFSRSGADEKNVEESTDSESAPAVDPLKEMASDLGLDETGGPSRDDFEEHYNHGVAYKEMGLVEEAIREFQAAAECVEESDGSRDLYNCCTMLGHCFIESGMPKLSLIWYTRAYERSDLNSDERLALEYELGNAYQLLDETDEALEHFERVYAVDVDFRDVASRLESLHDLAMVQA